MIRRTDARSDSFLREEALGRRRHITLGLRLGPPKAALDPTGSTGRALVSRGDRREKAEATIECEGRFGGPERYLQFDP